VLHLRVVDCAGEGAGQFGLLCGLLSLENIGNKNLLSIRAGKLGEVKDDGDGGTRDINRFNRRPGRRKIFRCSVVVVGFRRCEVGDLCAEFYFVSQTDPLRHGPLAQPHHVSTGSSSPPTHLRLAFRFAGPTSTPLSPEYATILCPSGGGIVLELAFWVCRPKPQSRTKPFRLSTPAVRT